MNGTEMHEVEAADIVSVIKELVDDRETLFDIYDLLGTANPEEAKALVQEAMSRCPGLAG